MRIPRRLRGFRWPLSKRSTVERLRRSNSSLGYSIERVRRENEHELKELGQLLKSHWRGK